ncbi:MAG: hypothetical protein ACR2LR_16805 [Hassallia sp.]
MKKFLHKVLTIVFAACMFIGIQAFGNSNGFQAFADDTVVSPQGIYYKGTPDESLVNKGNTGVDSAKSKLKETADNVRGSAKKPFGKDDNFDSAKSRLKETGDNARGAAKDFANSTKKGIKDAANSTGETVISPTGIYYKGTPDEANLGNKTSNSTDSKNPLESFAENVKEKLNLDEPIPESTKEFLDSTEKRVEKVVEPITGTKEGYHQIR